jgi:hypothetical protein
LYPSNSRETTDLDGQFPQQSSPIICSAYKVGDRDFRRPFQQQPFLEQLQLPSTHKVTVEASRGHSSSPTQRQQQQQLQTLVGGNSNSHLSSKLWRIISISTGQSERAMPPKTLLHAQQQSQGFASLGTTAISAAQYGAAAALPTTTTK